MPTLRHDTANEAVERARVKHALRSHALAYEIMGDDWRAKSYGRAEKLIDAVNMRDGSYIVSLDRPEDTYGIGESISRTIQKCRKEKAADETGCNGLSVLGGRHEDARRKLEAYQLFVGVLGVGHKTAVAMARRGYTRLDQIPDALRALSGKNIAAVPAVVRQGVAHFDALNQRVPRAEATAIIKRVSRVVSRALVRGQCISGDLTILPLGSYRREKATVGDIDLLLITEKEGETIDMRRLADDLTATGDRSLGFSPGEYLFSIIRGEKKHSFLYARAPKKKKNRRGSNSEGIDRVVVRVDLFKVRDRAEIPTFLLYATGSAEHNEYVRQVAKRRRMLLNEYGLFHIASPSSSSSSSTSKSRVAVRDEKDVYRALGLPFVHPRDRG